MVLKGISFGGTKWKDAVNLTHAYIKMGNIFNPIMIRHNWIKIAPDKFHFSQFIKAIDLDTGTIVKVHIC